MRVWEGEIEDREVTAIECTCHGYAGRDPIPPTHAEDRAAGGCGRPGCCSAAFVCRACGVRWVAMLPSPEME